MRRSELLPGVTTVEVTDIIGIFSDSKHEFEYQVPAEVVAVHPPLGSTEGSTVVTVQGVNLVSANTAKTICSFGDAEFTTAFEVSSVMIICESPAHPEGSVAVEVSVSDQGQQFSSSNALFDYALPLALRAAYPEGGPEEGGTVVSVQTDSLEGSLRTFGCRFGTVAPVSARKANDNIMQCMSPARDIGATQLEVTQRWCGIYILRDFVLLLAEFRNFIRRSCLWSNRWRHARHGRRSWSARHDTLPLRQRGC